MGWISYPPRMAFALNTNSGGGGTFPFVSLFNDDARYFVAVMDFGIDPLSVGTFQMMVVQKGKQGGNDVQGNPVISDQAAVAGTVTSGSVGSVPASNITPNFVTASAGWRHEWPLVVLAPGWSLTGYWTTADQLLTATFWWALVYPEELINPAAGDFSDDK